MELAYKHSNAWEDLLMARFIVCYINQRYRAKMNYCHVKLHYYFHRAKS